MKLLSSFLLLPLLLSCQRAKINYEAFKKAQDYSVPLWNNNPAAAKRVALLIFPHPDDEIVCGGTIVTLKQQGWEVDLLTLTQGEAGEKEARRKEWQNAMAALGINHSVLLDLPNNTWTDIENNKIIFWNENMDSIRHIVEAAIRQYQPSLLFTYDEVLGGYGHPEHRLTAVAVREVFEQNRQDSSFTPAAIFQSTLPQKMELTMLQNLDSYKKAVNEMGKDLPDPVIAFDITKTWPVKRRAAASYPSQTKTLKKFYLLPDEADTVKHYATFDREYYAVVKR
ncbi:MAG TPA: PIG-L family deacetylase [Chitinophagaceae bacterium]|nr:PIG-L family deacetylase [Chitinophagaceae bacterium]